MKPIINRHPDTLMKDPIDTLSETEMRQHINGDDPLPLATVAAIAEMAMRKELRRRDGVTMVVPVNTKGEALPPVPMLRPA